MDMNNIRDKVNKLLALSASPNEAEAKAALLKAHELIGRYKLTMVELEDKPTHNIVTLDTDITTTKYKTGYLFVLSNVIARACLCRALFTHYKGGRTHKIKFVGFEEDARIGVDIFTFVARFLKGELAKQERFYTSRGVKGKDKKARLDGYALGFAQGIKEAIDLQRDTSEWGLVMVTPKEVDDYMSANYTEKTKLNQNRLDGDAYARGVRDGKAFNVNGHSMKQIAVSA